MTEIEFWDQVILLLIKSGMTMKDATEAALFLVENRRRIEEYNGTTSS